MRRKSARVWPIRMASSARAANSVARRMRLRRKRWRKAVISASGRGAAMGTDKTRIMYIERKAESLNGPARIGRVSFSKTGRTLEYRGQRFQKSKSGYKWNHFDVETGDHYWISGPRKDGKDRLNA